MLRMKLMFVVLWLTAIVCIVPQAQAGPTIEVTIAGSSAMWQTMALGAYNLACAGKDPCATVSGIQGGHWTSNGNVVDLTDTRVAPNNVDAGTIWIVWTPGATKVWSFNKVDSVVGDRCYFAQPHCTVSGTEANLSGTGSNKIASNLWGDNSVDQALPAKVQSIFTAGTPVSVSATDIRPEDAAFAVCRANSKLGAGTAGGGSSDGLDGLGYNNNIPSGVCPATFGTSGGLASQSDYVGSAIASGYPGSTATANVLSFNITGDDPITGTAIPAFSVVRVGLEPIVFVVEHDKGQLTGATEATDKQLQQVFSGADCNGSEVGGVGGGIGVFLREPLSGTYNTTEATVMRKPSIYPGAILGVSMETGVEATNPLKAKPCAGGGGTRSRAIGTSEEVESVQNSGANLGTDGIGYTFFSYGNVNSIANKSAYGYLQLNGATTAGTFVDPIFASYSGGDPGEPGNGVLPAAANLPASCENAFPCPENEIWTGGLSFPNVRKGDYPSWSIVRLVSNGTPLGAAKALVTHSQGFVVTSVPDYIPATKTTAGGITDPGLTIQRSHYQQYDGAGNFLGAAPVNAVAKEAGGDMGGFIVPVSGKGAKTTQEVNADFPSSATRPTTP